MYSGELDLYDFRQLRTQYNSSALDIGTSALRKVGGMSPGPAASLRMAVPSSWIVKGD